jgi:hypothetical protein
LCSTHWRGGTIKIGVSEKFKKKKKKKKTGKKCYIEEVRSELNDSWGEGGIWGQVGEKFVDCGENKYGKKDKNDLIRINQKVNFWVKFGVNCMIKWIIS